MTEQQQFQKQIPKPGFQTAKAKYMGLQEEPKSGNKNGKAWQKGKLRFLIDGKEKENKFITWFPLTSEKSAIKTLDQLTQFKEYQIVWVESDQKHEGREWVEKKIVILNVSSEEGNSTVVSDTAPNTSQGSQSRISGSQSEHLASPTLNQQSPEHKPLVAVNHAQQPLVVKPEVFIEKYAKKYGDTATPWHCMSIYAGVLKKYNVGNIISKELIEGLMKVYNEKYDKDMGELL